MTPKFRAWDKRSNQMCEVLQISFELEFVQCTTGWVRTFFFGDEDCDLMQSTGLKDKNGKEIFEGDIVDVGTRIPFLNEIKRDCDSGYLKLVPIDKRWTEGFFTNYEDKSRYEVLGNIYENPELLEVEL